MFKGLRAGLIITASITVLSGIFAIRIMWDGPVTLRLTTAFLLAILVLLVMGSYWFLSNNWKKPLRAAIAKAAEPDLAERWRRLRFVGYLTFILAVMVAFVTIGMLPIRPTPAAWWLTIDLGLMGFGFLSWSGCLALLAAKRGACLESGDPAGNPNL